MKNQITGRVQHPRTFKLLSYREFAEAKRAGGIQTPPRRKGKVDVRQSNTAKTIIRTLREAADLNAARQSGELRPEMPSEKN